MAVGVGLSGSALVLLIRSVLEHGRRVSLNARFDAPVRELGRQHERLVLLGEHFGSRSGLVIGTAVVVIGALVTRRLRLAVVALLAMPGSALLTEQVLKPHVTAAAPFNSHPGFPSGHTTGAFAVAAGLTLLVLPAHTVHRSGVSYGGLLGGFVTIIAWLGATTTGFSVVAREAHNTVAAAGGALVAVTGVWGAALLVDALSRLIGSMRAEPTKREMNVCELLGRKDGDGTVARRRIQWPKGRAPSPNGLSLSVVVARLRSCGPL